MEGAPAIELDHVSVRSAEGALILDDLSWSLPAGECAGIIGASGSGKSTLLRLINRLDESSAGHVRVAGSDVTDWPPRRLRKHAVWVPQAPAPVPGTVRRYLDRPVELGAASARDHEARLPRALEIASFDPALAEREVASLSGGERLRLALARALVLDPDILLLDEPTSSLDGERAALVIDALNRWRRESGSTLVVVTHRLADVHRLGGQLLMLDRGRIAHAGETFDVLASPAGDDIRRTLAGEGPQ